jgi:hypothetical protein
MLYVGLFLTNIISFLYNAFGSHAICQEILNLVIGHMVLNLIMLLGICCYAVLSNLEFFACKNGTIVLLLSCSFMLSVAYLPSMVTSRGTLCGRNSPGLYRTAITDIFFSFLMAIGPASYVFFLQFCSREARVARAARRKFECLMAEYDACLPAVRKNNERHAAALAELAIVIAGKKIETNSGATEPLTPLSGTPTTALPMTGLPARSVRCAALSELLPLPVDVSRLIHGYANEPVAVSCSGAGAGVVVWESPPWRVDLPVPGDIAAVQVTGDSRLMAFDGYSLRVFDLETVGPLCVAISAPESVMPKPVRCLAVLPDDRLVSGNSDGEVRIWHTSLTQHHITSDLIDTLTTECVSFSVMPAKNLLVCGTSSAVFLFDYEKKARVGQLGTLKAGSCFVAALDPPHVAVARGTEIFIYNIETRALVCTLLYAAKLNKMPARALIVLPPVPMPDQDRTGDLETKRSLDEDERAVLQSPRLVVATSSGFCVFAFPSRACLHTELIACDRMELVGSLLVIQSADLLVSYDVITFRRIATLNTNSVNHKPLQLSTWIR